MSFGFLIWQIQTSPDYMCAAVYIYLFFFAHFYEYKWAKMVSLRLTLCFSSIPWIMHNYITSTSVYFRWRKYLCLFPQGPLRLSLYYKIKKGEEEPEVWASKSFKDDWVYFPDILQTEHWEGGAMRRWREHVVLNTRQRRSQAETRWHQSSDNLYWLD